MPGESTDERRRTARPGFLSWMYLGVRLISRGGRYTLTSNRKTSLHDTDQHAPVVSSAETCPSPSAPARSGHNKNGAMRGPAGRRRSGGGRQPINACLLVHTFRDRPHASGAM